MCCSAKKQRRAQAQAQAQAQLLAANNANSILYINDVKPPHNNASPPSYNAVINSNDMPSQYPFDTNLNNLNSSSEKGYNTFTNMVMTQNACSSAGQCCGGNCGTSSCGHQSCGGRGGCRSGYSGGGYGVRGTGGCGSNSRGGCGYGYSGNKCGSGAVFKLIKSMIEAKRRKKALRMAGGY